MLGGNADEHTKWEVETGGSGVQDQLQLHSDAEASLGHQRFCQKTYRQTALHFIFKNYLRMILD